MLKIKKANQLAEKIAKLKKEHKLDLSADEDLSIAIMNLISLEEHFFFTAVKTKKEKYYDLQQTVREMRKELLKKIVKDPEGETWCISKHLLSTCMRLMEVGTKYQTQDKKSEAQDLFNKAYDLYSLFWGINLKVINMGEVKKETNKTDLNEQLNNLVEELINCCEE